MNSMHSNMFFTCLQVEEMMVVMYNLNLFLQKLVAPGKQKSTK